MLKTTVGVYITSYFSELKLFPMCLYLGCILLIDVGYKMVRLKDNKRKLSTGIVVTERRGGQ